MLRNVLEDYLDSVKERDFDYPLTSLLFAMGFYDLHLTDGGSEFGKDFIAKRTENGITYQYVIQSKRGDINQSRFRDKVLGQLLEATLLKKLSHSQLDTSLPQRPILVSTGELIDNAFLELRALNDQLDDLGMGKVEFWGKNRLIELSEQYGLSGIHQTTARGLSGFAQFYLTYSKVLEGSLSDRQIEEYSRLWLDESLDRRRRILRAAIESDIIATKLLLDSRIYEAITVYLALSRLLMQTLYETDDEFIREIYHELIIEKILPSCRQLFGQFKSDWDEGKRDLIQLCFPESALPILNYLVWCARIIEIASVNFFLTEEKAERDDITSFLIEFIEVEVGCGHLPSDRYAVCVVWPVLALIISGRIDKAIQLIKRSVIWLCDRFENEVGIGRYDVDEYGETVALLGYPFEFIEIEKNNSSYLATVLCDLAAFTGDRDFYADVCNDIAASEISYSYWQFPDTKAILTIETEEVLTYPNIPHQESITRFEDYTYSEHMRHEPESFQITEKAGIKALMFLSLLLKDRYFPKTWNALLQQNDPNAGTPA